MFSRNEAGASRRRAVAGNLYTRGGRGSARGRSEAVDLAAAADLPQEMWCFQRAGWPALDAAACLLALIPLPG